VDGPQVGGVAVEGAGADDQVFRVGGFQDQDPARNKGAVGRVQQSDQGFQGQVFDEMEGRDRAEALGRLVAEVPQGVGRFDLKAESGAHICGCLIEIDAPGGQPLLPKQLQPFAPTAPDVQDRGVLLPGPGALQVRQVHAQSALDLFP